MSQEEGGRVSVIIPARNEEANIERVVRSVASQAGVKEILVVDDQSEDRTPEILGKLGREFARLRVLRTETLPEGWVGKSYALAQAAREASGEWLLFTDADTEHLPGSLEALAARARRERADLLSISPGQQTATWWEKAVIPLVYATLAGLFRFEEVSDPASSAAAANGQYLLVRREIYERAGGHAAVRGTILEDVELARRIKQAGGRLVFLPGADWVRTRMYRTFGEMWRGWTKNLYLLYEGRLARMLARVAALLVLGVIPTALFCGFSVALAAGRGGAGVIAATVVSFALALLRQWQYARALSRLGFDARLAGYQPAGAALLSLLLLNSAIAHRWRGSVEWKGRAYRTRVNR